jgi:hypothetical protein
MCISLRADHVEGYTEPMQGRIARQDGDYCGTAPSCTAVALTAPG